MPGIPITAKVLVIRLKNGTGLQRAFVCVPLRTYERYACAAVLYKNPFRLPSRPSFKRRRNQKVKDEFISRWAVKGVRTEANLRLIRFCP